MAWIRLSDNYFDHPKILILSALAFRLWHESLAFARRHQTDGVITFEELKSFRYLKPSCVTELVTPPRQGGKALWDEVPGVGYQIHDYLDWNESKEALNERRAESKERMRSIRDRRRAPSVTTLVRANTSQTTQARSQNVLVRYGTDLQKKEEKKEDDAYERAGRLREELYPAWYSQYRKGARLPLVANSLELEAAVVLCQTWDDARIEKLARIILTTDDEWISRTDRGFNIFAKKAAWADDRLRQAENGAV